MNTTLVVGWCERWETSGRATIHAIRYAKGDLHAGELFCGLNQVLCLVIKEDVGAQNVQDWAFVDPAEELGKSAWRQRIIHVGALMRPECIEALVLHDSLRRVIGEYTVGVERNA